MKKFLSLLILFFLSASARAEYLKFALRELSLVKGASLFTERAEESPFPVTVVTAEEIERFGWFNLRDLLEYQPSFYLVQDVNERVVAHRGLYRTVTSHLLFLEDGFKLHLPMMENFIPDASFPMTGISRVEIIRGPGASLYGDAALTGVINLERRNFPPEGFPFPGPRRIRQRNRRPDLFRPHSRRRNVPSSFALCGPSGRDLQG